MMSKKALLSSVLVALTAGLVGWDLFSVPGLVSATDQSSDVAMIGSPSDINGAPLIVSGGAFDTFNFTNLAPGDVDSDALSDFDTVVLNVASSEMACDTGTLSTDAKAALVDFVSAGGKLIIYDSECPPNDYSWLPFPFTTANPGAMGGYGTATIVEDNTLSSNDPSDPYYIDAANLGSQTDAIGDMNVMTTRDSHWCLDIQGTNSAQQTGPVHVYARYGSGLIVYNGMDIDYMGYEPSPPYPNGLEKIWLQELQQPFNPDGLPCGQRVVTPTPGIRHRTSTPEPTTEPTQAPPTVTPVPVQPTVAPPAATATPSGAAGPVIAPPSTGSGGSNGGTVWGLFLLAAAGLAALTAGTGVIVLRLRRR
jgi:hypothetical protein